MQFFARTATFPDARPCHNSGNDRPNADKPPTRSNSRRLHPSHNRTERPLLRESETTTVALPALFRCQATARTELTWVRHTIRRFPKGRSRQRKAEGGHQVADQGQRENGLTRANIEHTSRPIRRSDPPYPTPSPVILLRVPIIRPETNHGHHLPPFLPSSSPAHPLPTAPVIPNPSILPPGSMVPRTEGKHLRFLLRLPGRTKWSDLYASLTLLGCGIPDAPPTGRRTYFPLAGRGRRCVPHIRD
jgi:hypothetical protein